MIQTYIISIHGASPYGASPPHSQTSDNVKADFLSFILVLSIILGILVTAMHVTKGLK